MFRRDLKTTFEPVDPHNHKEHEVRNTRVSEYLRKYGQGKIDSMPTDPRAEVTDERSVEQMLGDEYEPTMADEQLDMMLKIDENREKFEAMRDEIEMTKKQRESFDAAIKVINSPNSSYEQKQEAYEVLDELSSKGKVTRARK